MPSKSNSPSSSSEFRPGETFAERYKIIGPLGSGAYSAVYRAENLVTTELVALKVLRTAAAPNNQVVSQYRLELNLLRQIQHPGLVRILDFGEYSGRLYVAMELIEGPTLRENLQTVGRVPVEEFTRFFGELCEALGKLHAQHVIHCDLHPGNIMSTLSGAWKLMDIGIARYRRGAGHSATPYAAPEQLMGQPPSFATDIHSLGIVFYEMLTGRRRRPDGESTPRFLEAEISGAPAGLGSLIETCIQVDPRKRFQSVEDLKTAGAQILNSSGRKRIDELKTESAANSQEMLVLFARIVEALRKVHATGMTHAELSPSKIWLKGDAIEIETFSKTSAPAPSQSTLMITDAKYTAPELIMARSIPDLAAHTCGDIYVLGFLFYELLVGKQEMQRQFADLEQMHTGLAWMRWHADPKLRLRPLAEAAPSCPKGLIELIERMAEKDPSQRVRTLEEVAQALDVLNVRLARTQPYVVSPPAPPKRHKRHTTPNMLALAAATAVAVLVGMAGAWWLASGGWRKLTNMARGTPGAASVIAVQTPAMLNTANGLMMLVPEGEFLMGDNSVPNESPAHTVRLGSYYMDRLEISNRYYREFCSRTGSRMPEPPSWDLDYFSKDNHPVVNVGRGAAEEFCRFAGKRLPSEEEWEKAARGQEDPAVLWGNWTLPGLANLQRDGTERPSAVGSFAADVSPYGVLDTAGNVQEWVAGDYKLYAGNRTAPNASDAAQGVVRGGSFAKPAEHLSPARREPLPANASVPTLSTIGFRCAADVQAGLGLLSRREVASSSQFDTRQ